MTRKDYVAIAEALRRTHPATATHPAVIPLREQWEADVHAIAQAFKSDNPRFDASRFFQACGLDS